MLPQILPLFPENVSFFYDVFTGGGNVAVNAKANKIVASDICEPIIDLYNYFLSKKKEKIFKEIESAIAFFGLSDTTKNGYDFYGAESSSGLASVNREAYKKLKKFYNEKLRCSFSRNILFYLLIVFGFNNQIRFNKSGGFNMPVGKRDFNKNNQKNLTHFLARLHEGNISFLKKDYASLALPDEEDEGFSSLEDVFVYCDPPYLITTASYNENGGWSESDEKKLLEFLLSLHNKGVKFALSNVLESKGKKNNLLIEWIKKNGFNAHSLNATYAHSSYHGKNKDKKTLEVLVTNYSLG